MRMDTDDEVWAVPACRVEPDVLTVIAIPFERLGYLDECESSERSTLHGFEAFDRKNYGHVTCD